MTKHRRVIRFAAVGVVLLAAGSGPSAALADSLQPLDFFQGRWSCQGEFPRTGKHISSEERFAPDLVGRWLVMRHDDHPPFGFHALEMWGYDTAQKRFVDYAFDNVPEVREYVSLGWVGSQLTWTLPGQSGKADRFVFMRQSQAQYQVDYSITLGGKAWILVDTLTCRRQGTRSSD
jgi:hypothetical protein